MIGKFLKIFLLITMIVFSSSCAQEEERVPVSDAQSQILASAKFSADRCGTPIPEPPLIIVSDPIKRNLDLCTISITRTGCPFTAYPLPCLLIYLQKDPGNIPWYVNFNEISKQTIK
ncbi:MAG: hypothetical protein SH817_07765 [Leptospira sp.]|nr:hypothetical protein [Leptospira sp.]